MKCNEYVRCINLSFCIAKANKEPVMSLVSASVLLLCSLNHIETIKEIVDDHVVALNK